MRDSVRGSAPLSRDMQTRPRFLPRREALDRPEFRHPQAGEAGHLRMIMPGLQATNCLVATIMVPFGRWTPHHTSKAEHIMLGLRGSLDFIVGTERFVVAPWDQLFLPANTFYQYGNCEPEDAWVCSVLTRFDEWPASPGEYLNPGEVPWPLDGTEAL